MTDAARRLRRLVWRTRARTAVLVALPFLAFAGLLFWVFNDTYDWHSPETARLLSERLIHDSYGNRLLWMIEVEGEGVRSLKPHPDVRFEPGRRICIMRARGAALGLEKSRLVQDGPCP